MRLDTTATDQPGCIVAIRMGVTLTGIVLVLVHGFPAHRADTLIVLAQREHRSALVAQQHVVRLAAPYQHYSRIIAVAAAAAGNCTVNVPDVTD